MTQSVPSSTAVTWRHDGALLLVVIDNPPVNALSVHVRSGLIQAIDQAQANPAVQAVVIAGNGSGFIAGADIREFGRPPQAPVLTDVCNHIEACSKPVVAAIHGVALGGGLEVALAAHYRIAMPGARLGLPEVTLGLLPGAGGTQRLPRLVGIPVALDMMLGGKPVNTERALALGLVDKSMSGESALACGARFAHELLQNGAKPRPTRHLQAHRTIADGPQAIAESQAVLDTRYRGLFSPGKIIDLVQATLDQPFDEALAHERSDFLQCLETPQRSALTHAFFAERQAGKIPGLEKVAPRKVEHVGVIGGGTMGVGISVAMLDAGLAVTLIERDQAAVEKARTAIEKIYAALVAKGRIDTHTQNRRMAQLSGSTRFPAVSQADLVIEAVFEDKDAKAAVFAQLDAVCKPGAILATNTSYLDVNALAAGTSRPRDVIGLHFFSPANVMRLLEIVVPEQVADDVVATAFAFARTLGKVPVRSGVCDGFIGNRILAVYRQAVDFMLEDGASPYQIDQAVRAFGFPMGPLQVSDLAGGDIGWATRKRKALTRDPRIRYVSIADQLCERGWFGQKTGRGWYQYPDGARQGQQDPKVLALIDEHRQRAGRSVQSFSQEDILRRYMAAMINEGANVVHDQIALRPLDVDVVMMHGYGFPRFRGGPMHYADHYGLDRVLADIREFQQHDPVFWQPSPLLESLVEGGKTFASLNAA
jgi:3-hydroxyacyl-CoA dehydrogenase